MNISTIRVTTNYAEVILKIKKYFPCSFIRVSVFILYIYNKMSVILMIYAKEMIKLQKT